MRQKKSPSNFKMTPAVKAAAKPAASTDVRNSAVPPKTAGAKKELAWDQIARRAYFIWQSRGGSEIDNWLQAERELRSA